jgi:hypothetical protein
MDDISRRDALAMHATENDLQAFKHLSSRAVARYAFADAMIEASKTEQRSPVTDSGMEQRSQAWLAVCDVLNEVKPGWGRREPSAMASAVTVIREMSARPPVEAVSEAIGVWLSAALDDPKACPEFKRDIRAWFAAGQPTPSGELVEFFRSLDGHYLGWQGDQNGWSTEHTAVVALRYFLAVCDSFPTLPQGDWVMPVYGEHAR